MRLPAPAAPPWPVKLLHAWQRRRHGQVLEPTAMWSHRPAAMAAFLALFGVLRRRGSPLPQALRALVSVRVSQIVECAFCVEMNSALLARAGGAAVSPQRLAGWRDDAAWSAAERAALEYAEAMSATPPAVTDDLVARLREHFTPEAIVELTAVVALQNMSARFNAALDARPASACAVPPHPGA